MRRQPKVDPGTSQDGSRNDVPVRAPKTPPGVTSETPALRVTPPVVSDPDIKYIASSRQYPFIRTDIVLPPTLDEAELVNGLQIYDDMAYDPTMAGLQLWAKTNTLSDGLTVEPRELDAPEGQEMPDEADMREALWCRRYVKFALARLERLDRPLFSILWNMLDGVRLPHKLAEVQFDTIVTGEFAGWPGIHSIRPKPRANYNYVIDEMNTFRGVVALVPGGSQALWSGLIFDASQIPNCISPEKLMTFSMSDRDGDPRGISGWQGSYQPWARCQQLYMEMMAMAQASAGGKVAIIMGEEQRSTVYNDPVTGKQMSSVTLTATQASQWGNNGILVLNSGSQVNVYYPPSGAFDGFVKGIQEAKREMALGFLTNARAIFEAEHGSKADAETGKDSVDPVKQLLRTRICLMLDRLFFNLVKLAKGEEYAIMYAPRADMNSAQAPDFALNGTTFSQLLEADGVTPSQLSEYMTDKLGVRAPTPNEQALLDAAWKKKLDAKINPPEIQSVVNPNAPAIPSKNKTVKDPNE